MYRIYFLYEKDINAWQMFIAYSNIEDKSGKGFTLVLPTCYMIVLVKPGISTQKSVNS